jgi:predicted RNA binding protein YcfA (HicA-like mRNA interferase family)
VSRLRPLEGERVVKALQKAGFQVMRQRGSHFFLTHPDGRATVVPIHKGEELGRGLLRKIIHDAELTREEFLEFLREV